ncbi:MAG: zf-HC2 domain-containing protein [Gemmatimonadaceae bacterium]
MTDRSTCETVVRQLWQYLDGDVPPDKRALVQSHLEICVGCASHFEFAREFLNAVASAPVDGPADDELRDRVLVALAGEGFKAH